MSCVLGPSAEALGVGGLAVFCAPPENSGGRWGEDLHQPPQGFPGIYAASFMDGVQSSSLCTASSHPLQSTVFGEKSGWEAGTLITVPDFRNAIF